MPSRSEVVQDTWYGCGAIIKPATDELPRHLLAANELPCWIEIRVYDIVGQPCGAVLLGPGPLSACQLYLGMDTASYCAISCAVPPRPAPPPEGLLRWQQRGGLTREERHAATMEEEQARQAAAQPWDYQHWSVQHGADRYGQGAAR